MPSAQERASLGGAGRPPPPLRRPLPQLPWKSLTSIIEYYYMWKTTDRYVQQVRASWRGRVSPLQTRLPASDPVFCVLRNA